MATTQNTFGLLLGEDLQAAGASKRNKKKGRSKKKDAAEATQSSGLPPTAGQQLEEEHGGFLTVGKGSRGKGLASAKSLERMPSAQLATEALQDLETQARSPDIQDTLERWTQKVQANNKASSDGSGKIAAWKEALLASDAVEILISTCLSERIDSSLEPLLAALFTAIAHDGSAEKRNLAEVMAAAIVTLAQAMDHTSQPNVEAAQKLLKLLLSLLQSPDEAPSQPRPLQPEPVEDAELEKLIAQKTHQLAAAKLPMQVVLWKEIVNLREPAASGLQSYAPAPEPAALASLRQFENALCSLQEDPGSLRRAADLQKAELVSRKQLLEGKLRDAESLVANLKVELSGVELNLLRHDACKEEHVQALSTEALQLQLQLVKQLRGRLDVSKPVAATNGHNANPLAVATYVDAARNLLMAQLRLQREVASKGMHAKERHGRKRQQVDQLRTLGHTADLVTADSQLGAIEDELQRYTAESAGVCASADALAHAIQRYEVPPHIASEFAELAAACRQQHGVILSGPLRLQSARLETIAQDLRAPSIGSSVSTALQPPTAAGRMPPIGQLAEDNPVVQPGHDTAAAAQPAAFAQWTPAANPVQSAWSRQHAPNFGELLQGSSVSQAPSKVPAPIAPASFHSSSEVPRGGMPSMPHGMQPPHMAPIGTLSADSIVANGTAPHVAPVQDSAAPPVTGHGSVSNGVDGRQANESPGSKPKRNRTRKPRAGAA